MCSCVRSNGISKPYDLCGNQLFKVLRTALDNNNNNNRDITSNRQNNKALAHNNLPKRLKAMLNVKTN